MPWPETILQQTFNLHGLDAAKIAAVKQCASGSSLKSASLPNQASASSTFPVLAAW